MSECVSKGGREEIEREKKKGESKEVLCLRVKRVKKKKKLWMWRDGYNIWLM